MSRQLFAGATVLRGTEWVPERTDVLVEDGTVVAFLDPGAAVDAARVEVGGRLLTAGLVNGHTHSHTVPARGVNRDWTLETSLLHGGWLSAPRSAELAELSALLTGVELLSSGCTGLFDLAAQAPGPDLAGLHAVAQGYARAGVRAVVAPMVADRSVQEAVPAIGSCCGVPAPGTATAVLLERSGQWLAERLPGRVSAAVAPTIPAHCTDELTRGLHALAREHGARVHLHLAESAPQAISGKARFGHSVTRELHRLGVLDEHLTVAHAIWVDESDAALLAEAGAVVVTVPGSNLRLGSGVADTRALLTAGVRLAVGTDGANSADRFDQLDAARLTALLSRVTARGPAQWLTPEETLGAASVGGAEACGWSGVGSLEVGQAADLVAYDLSSPAFRPANDLTNQLLTAARTGDVDQVWVGGERVFGPETFAGLSGAWDRFDELVAELHDRSAPAREQARRHQELSADAVDALRQRAGEGELGVRRFLP